MAMTLEKEQRLDRVGLVAFFKKNTANYESAAKEAHSYIKKGFSGATVRPDDLLKPLKSVIEIDTSLRTYLVSNKLTQKYWVDDFVVLVLDRCWDNITAEE